MLQHFGYKVKTKATGGDSAAAAAEVYSEHPFAWIVGYPFEEPVESFTYFYPDSWVVNREYYSSDRCPLDADGLPRLIVTPVDGRCPGEFDFDYTGQPIHIPDGPFPKLYTRDFEITANAAFVLSNSNDASESESVWSHRKSRPITTTRDGYAKSVAWLNSMVGVESPPTETTGDSAAGSEAWPSCKGVNTQEGQIDCLSETVVEGEITVPIDIGVTYTVGVWQIVGYTRGYDPRRYYRYGYKRWQLSRRQVRRGYQSSRQTFSVDVKMETNSGDVTTTLLEGVNAIRPGLIANLEVEPFPTDLGDLDITLDGIEEFTPEELGYNSIAVHNPYSISNQATASLGSVSFKWKVTFTHTSN